MSTQNLLTSVLEGDVADASTRLGEKLAEMARGIPHVKRFLKNMKHIANLDNKKVAEAFLRKLQED